MRRSASTATALQSAALRCADRLLAIVVPDSPWFRENRSPAAQNAVASAFAIETAHVLPLLKLLT